MVMDGHGEEGEPKIDGYIINLRLMYNRSIAFAVDHAILNSGVQGLTPVQHRTYISSATSIFGQTRSCLLERRLARTR